MSESTRRTVALSEAEAQALRSLHGAVVRASEQLNGALAMLASIHGITAGHVSHSPDCTSLVVEE